MLQVYYNSSLISGVKPTTENNDDTLKQDSASRNVCNVPFRHIDVHTFFTDRNEVVERAIHDCTEKLIKENNEELIGSWLLTEYALTIYIVNFSYPLLLQFWILIRGEFIYSQNKSVGYRKGETCATSNENSLLCKV